jgi:TRAP-type mannitol/chloroaromatic compound transport system substrate-binding protein
MSTTYRTSYWMPLVIVVLLLIIVVLMALLVRAQLIARHEHLSQTGAHQESADQSALSAPAAHSSNQPLAPERLHAPQVAAAYHWKLVTSWPKNFPGLGQAPENFSALVDAMSAGRLKITVYGANQLVPPMGVFGAVSSGSAEMGHSSAYYWRGKIPAAVFFTSVPFGMNAQEMNGWLHYGGGLALWRELYAPFNLIPFAGGNTGVQMGGWFNRPIQSVDDIKGLKMRIPGIGGDVFSRAGGTSVNIPGGDLYQALQSGLIDATEWVGPYNDLAFGFHQIAKYYYYPGWQEPGPTLEFTVNKAAYENLPLDLQKIIEVAARAVNQDMLDEYTARNNTALQDLQTKYQVNVLPYPPEVLAAFAKASRDVYQDISATDADFARVYQHYNAFLQEAQKYHELTEKAYFISR